MPGSKIGGTKRAVSGPGVNTGWSSPWKTFVTDREIPVEPNPPQCVAVLLQEIGGAIVAAPVPRQVALGHGDSHRPTDLLAVVVGGANGDRHRPRRAGHLNLGVEGPAREPSGWMGQRSGDECEGARNGRPVANLNRHAVGEHGLRHPLSVHCPADRQHLTNDDQRA